MLVSIQTAEQMNDRFKKKEALFFKQFNAVILTGEYLLQDNNSIGQFLHHCKYLEIPAHEHPVPPTDPLVAPETKWFLILRCSQLSDYPDIANSAVADNSIIELPELICNNFAVWIPQSSIK